MLKWLAAFNVFVLLYYAYSTLHYLALMIGSFRSNAQHQRRLRAISLENMYSSPFTPPVTVIVPAHNEAGSIVETVRSLLRLTYPELYVLVVNDGSSDRTLEALVEAFNLIPTRYVTPSRLHTQPVHDAYMSVSESRLLVLDKDQGGKSDALNAGLNAVTTPYFCAIDADVILEGDAMLRVMLPFVLDPAHVVAVGGIVRVVNGCTVTGGQIQNIGLPRGVVEAVQVIEYFRGFLFGREGWSALNALLIIAGAFGCFSHQLVMQIGGYSTSCIGEDMDLVVRLHRHLRKQGRRDYRIRFIPDPVCWTLVPATLGALARQRKRWQKGLAQVLWSHRDMMLNPRYGLMGMIAFPYQVVVELLGPVVEMAGWFAMLAAASLGLISVPTLLYFLVLAYLAGTAISMASVVLEELTYRRYQRIADVIRLWRLCALEFFPYRQFLIFWRVVALLELARGKIAWGSQGARQFKAAPASGGGTL